MFGTFHDSVYVRACTFGGRAAASVLTWLLRGGKAAPQVEAAAQKTYANIWPSALPKYGTAMQCREWLFLQ